MSAVDELLAKLIRPARVLLVEDDVDAAEPFVQWLTNYYECELHWVKDGESAIQFVESTGDPLDIVFIDLVLPRASGVDVLRVLKRKMPDVPVLIVTGMPSSELATEAAALGVVGLFIKPVSAAALKNVFRVYKIRARDRFDSEYFRQQRPSRERAFL